ncbi:MAG: aldehyde dehydrogenase family protein [Planctomycetota bacterium]
MPRQLMQGANFIGNAFQAIEGDAILSTNPADADDIVWTGAPNIAAVDEAVQAARAALPAWAALSMDERIAFLRRWQEITTERKEEVAQTITREMGKTLAEARFEAGALAGKVDITLDDISVSRVREYSVSVNASRDGHCRYKPHGVMAVIGPFNFPAHLPNGHIIPALLLGNTIVFKPSEKTPAVGQLLAEMMQQIGLPAGVFNLVHGAGDVAARLVDHDDIDGVLFTGSWPVGRRILETNLDRPGRIIALELGGNNPAIVLDDAPFKLAVVECARAAFATTGQRCTCTRRIIVQRGIADRFIPAFCQAASSLLIGPGDSDSPVFMGPLVTSESRDAVVRYQQDLVERGGTVLVEATFIDGPGNFISPGVVQMPSFSLDHDVECFGPLAQIAVVDDVGDAINQANATNYGLAAAMFTRSREQFDRFFDHARAGCVNWNTGTAGASGKLPFGGLGYSGNHRPAGAFSVDYCAYPVANMVEHGEEVAVPGGMHWDDAWDR